MKHSFRLFLCIMASWATAMAQQTPADAQTEASSIVGATAQIGDGTVVENATLVFENGKITALGGTDTATKGTVIDAAGKHLYPGFIAPVKSLGLVEIDAVRPTHDEDEIGELLPHIRSLIAYNAESKVVESMRPNGILLGQITPEGGTISGTSSIVQFDAWNWEDAVVKADDGIHLHWPRSFRRGRWWMGEEPGFHPNKDYQKEMGKITTFLSNAKAYAGGGSKTQHFHYAAMEGLFSGKQRLYVYTQGEKEITDAITTLKKQGVQHVVLVGGYHAHRVTDLLKQHQVPVLVNQTHGLPFFEDDDYDLNYKLPKLLTDAGILTGLQNTGMSNFQTRNLPFYAGQLVGQGMDKEKALQLITGNTAQILGIADHYGTLAVGKSATLFISVGDALDMRGNQLTHAFIDGRQISLDTHQTQLWKRYMGKYEGK
ncbi:MAG: amidohydrolase family protein [Flavobacteriaceae bacterium]